MSIIPAVGQTPNGKIACLLWKANIDPDILKAIQRGEYLAHHVSTAQLTTRLGNIPYLLIILGTEDEFADLGSSPFFADLILSPSQLTHATCKEWLKTLKSQASLRLEICLEETTRSIVLMKDAQLREYVDSLEQSILDWQSIPPSQEASAIEEVSGKLDHFIQSTVTELLDSQYALRQQPLNAQLLHAFGQTCIIKLGNSHPLTCQVTQATTRQIHSPTWKSPTGDR